MQKAIDNLRVNLARVKQLGGLHGAITTLTSPVVDSSDMLRAQIVLMVSALDCYIHELTQLGMVEVYEGKRPPGSAYENFRVPAGAISAGALPSGSGWFAEEIRDQHSFKTFQQPDKIAEAIRLFSNVKLWSVVSLSMKRTEKDVKDTLSLIVARRNKIAHEADMDPSYPGTRWPISQADVSGALLFIETLCESIHASVA